MELFSDQIRHFQRGFTLRCQRVYLYDNNECNYQRVFTLRCQRVFLYDSNGATTDKLKIHKKT